MVTVLGAAGNKKPVQLAAERVVVNTALAAFV
jgi:hypothetical protein